MNKFTQAMWEMIHEALDDDEELLADVQKILLREYKPFLKRGTSVRSEYPPTSNLLSRQGKRVD